MRSARTPAGPAGARQRARSRARPAHRRRAWKRALKRCVTIPVLGGQLLVVSGIIVCLYSCWTWIYCQRDLSRPLKTALVSMISLSWGVLVEFLNWQVSVRAATCIWCEVVAGSSYFVPRTSYLATLP